MLPKGIDGVDFINVYSKGKTELGRWLSNFAHTPIDIPEHGHFESIEGYWYWLGCEDDSLRSLYGWQAKSQGRKCTNGIDDAKRADFQDLIKKAIDIKLKSNFQMMLVFAASELPLVHFYEYGDKRIDAGYKWITCHLEHRRSLLKAWAKEKGYL